MPEYRRSKLAGGTFFFTVVTYHRYPILTTEESRHILRAAWENVMKRYPFTIDAICLLPDHLHCIWTLPEEDMNYSLRWGEIKKLFSKEYLKRIGRGETRNESRIKKGEAAIWQRRFWEHAIRDEEDFNRHLDYIHYNPVKHGLVKNVLDWPWSSFHRYVTNGYYAENWGEMIGKTTEGMEAGE
jgi:putative transposase